MRALFLTTETDDCFNHVRAWNSFARQPAQHVTYNHRGLRASFRLVQAAQEYRPDVIFYIGAHDAPGNPRADDFRKIRRLGPFIHLCSDAQDRPWHRTLGAYDLKGCFSLQVAIDGALNVPVGHTTLTPVDPRPFDLQRVKDIRCGFSGSIGRWNARSEIVLALKWFGGLTIRERGGDYEDHAAFLSRCRMVLNISRTGTGLADHIKGRVLETGYAGACLLESVGSPIVDWFPEDCYFLYDDPPHAARLIAELTDTEIDRAARRLSEEVKTRFTARQIYEEILNVVRPKPQQAA